jgi:acetoin utilization deacetylase AcuC-like enzyme
VPPDDPAPVLLHHPSSLRHDVGPHPEQPARLEAIAAELAQRDWLGWTARESRPAPRAAVEAVHPARYVDWLEAFCGAGGGAIDMDTVVVPASFEAALHAAGGAVEVVDLLLGDAPVRAAASAHRPPGHHALRARAMGFCLLANAAIAAQHALDAHGLDRVLILDWDVHHGNGTNDIFHARDDVLFVSIHESPLYPGTGSADDAGSEAGEGYTVNLPVPGGSGDETWVSLVEHVVRPLAREYEPQLVLVSAGYDAHVEDPLAGCRVTDGGYAAMAASMRAVAADVGAPLGVILEGGYALRALARSFAATLEVVGAPAAPAPAPAPAQLTEHPLAREAAARLGPRWTALRPA